MDADGQLDGVEFVTAMHLTTLSKQGVCDITSDGIGSQASLPLPFVDGVRDVVQHIRPPASPPPTPLTDSSLELPVALPPVTVPGSPPPEIPDSPPPEIPDTPPPGDVDDLPADTPPATPTSAPPVPALFTGDDGGVVVQPTPERAATVTPTPAPPSADPPHPPPAATIENPDLDPPGTVGQGRISLFTQEQGTFVPWRRWCTVVSPTVRSHCRYRC